MGKLCLTAADHLAGLLSELELQPITAAGKGASPAKAVMWRQGHVLALLYLDTMAAQQAAEACRREATGGSLTPRSSFSTAQFTPRFLGNQERCLRSYPIRLADRNGVHAVAKPEQFRIYLSAATLLVVPATLIGHWQEQVLFFVSSNAATLIDALQGFHAQAMVPISCLRMCR